jgi:hypothetical protein
MKSTGSISMNILRIALFLIFLGFILPLGCKANGFQISQGILGNNDMGKGAILLSPINDFYAFLFFAVFIIAAIGLVITFKKNINNSFIIAFICLILSSVFMFIILLKFKIYFIINEFSFLYKYCSSDKNRTINRRLFYDY